ncbi:phosphotransferase enzyme family protein [Streptomyces sp. NPDC057137]|uniref:phosphotransferase enzyme family protein n=1 Tax=Streptomyces sp. NPDC057137 TaxID=3346030 RepID=UPI0036355DC5
MLLDASEIARAFGVGRPLGVLRPLSNGDHPSSTCVLDTDRGRWVVKTSRLHGDWQRSQARESHRLESAALAAGIAMPRPVEPPSPAVGYWHNPSGADLVRVTEWVDGHDLRRSGGAASAASLPDAAQWVGSTLARIALLGLNSDGDDTGRKPLHSMDDWRAWIAEAEAGTHPVARPARSLLPIIEDATTLIGQAERNRPPLVPVHADISQANVLRTPDGYVLIDWDGTGREVPWWETVSVAFRFTTPFNGPMAEGDARVVRPLIDAYLAEGGPAGAPDISAFAGMLRSQLAVTAWSLWLALGHRQADAAQRAFGLRIVTTASHDLPQVLRSLDRWTGLLR